MPAFQLLRCMVNQGGDDDTQVYRDRTRPIVFPELPLLQFLHGEDAINDVHVVGTWNTTNEEVFRRLQQIYAPEALQAVFPGNRPRLPMSDPSIPRCTLPIHKPRPTLPDNPDPKLLPLDQFTMTDDMPVVDAEPLPPEDDPTPDEIAAHVQEDDEVDEFGFTRPNPADLPHQIYNNQGISSRRDGANPPHLLPDVNAGGSKPPDFDRYQGGTRGKAKS